MVIDTKLKIKIISIDQIDLMNYNRGDSYEYIVKILWKRITPLAVLLHTRKICYCKYKVLDSKIFNIIINS